MWKDKGLQLVMLPTENEGSNLWAIQHGEFTTVTFVDESIAKENLHESLAAYNQELFRLG
jgi:hypothetical protein